MAIVYKITNKINGKSYIGYTKRALDQRWNSHLASVRQGSKFKFHRAIRKYGVDQWNKEILFEHDDIDVCRKKEEDYIQEFNTIIFGYNTRSGGCGGWIVPQEKYESWRLKQKEINSGLNNGNSVGYTNEQLLDIGKKICQRIGRIVTHSVMVKECAKINIRFPKSFRPIRFNGSYKNYALILEKELNMKFNPQQKTEEHKQKLRQANLGKKRK